MPSDFFEQLVQNRRDGIAPPQIEQMKQGEPEPEQQKPPQVTYWPTDLPGVVECQRCWSLVRDVRAPDHADEHYRGG